MVSSLEKRYLSSTGLSPFGTYFIASLKNVWCDNHLLRVLPSTFARQFHHNFSPKSPLCAYSFQKGSKLLNTPFEKKNKSIKKDMGNLFLKKREEERKGESTHDP